MFPRALKSFTARSRPTAAQKYRRHRGRIFTKFAKREIAEKLLREAGFNNVDLAVVDCAWDLSAPEGLAEIYEKGTVRAAMVLSNQPPQNLTAIRSAMAQAVQKRFAYGDRWRVPVPAALLRAAT